MLLFFGWGLMLLPCWDWWLILLGAWNQVNRAATLCNCKNYHSALECLLTWRRFCRKQSLYWAILSCVWVIRNLVKMLLRLVVSYSYDWALALTYTFVRVVSFCKLINCNRTAVILLTVSAWVLFLFRKCTCT